MYLLQKNVYLCLIETKKQNEMKNLSKRQKAVLLTKKGEVSKNITNALWNCRFEGNKIYHTYTSGSGRFTTNHSAKWTLLEILKAFNYKYTEGNDSPRGGKCGDYLKVSKRAMEFIKSIK